MQNVAKYINTDTEQKNDTKGKTKSPQQVISYFINSIHIFIVHTSPFIDHIQF